MEGNKSFIKQMIWNRAQKSFFWIISKSHQPKMLYDNLCINFECLVCEHFYFAHFSILIISLDITDAKLELKLTKGDFLNLHFLYRINIFLKNDAQKSSIYIWYTQSILIFFSSVLWKYLLYINITYSVGIWVDRGKFGFSNLYFSQVNIFE